MSDNYWYMRIFTVMCDKCSEVVDFDTVRSKSHGMKLARDNGWTVGEKYVRCPNCNGKGDGLCVTNNYREKVD